jgi:hypothetical protein
VAGAHPAGNLHRLQVFVPEHTGPQLGFSRIFATRHGSMNCLQNYTQM